MQIQRIIGLVLVVGGVLLLIQGIREADSFGSQLSKFFTDSPSDRAIWMTLGGVAAIIVGSTGALLPARVAKG